MAHGCGKCRYSVAGCSQCRNPGFTPTLKCLAKRAEVQSSGNRTLRKAPSQPASKKVAKKKPSAATGNGARAGRSPSSSRKSASGPLLPATLALEALRSEIEQQGWELDEDWSCTISQHSSGHTTTIYEHPTLLVGHRPCSSAAEVLQVLTAAGDADADAAPRTAAAGAASLAAKESGPKKIIVHLHRQQQPAAKPPQPQRKRGRPPASGQQGGAAHGSKRQRLDAGNASRSESGETDSVSGSQQAADSLSLETLSSDSSPDEAAPDELTPAAVPPQRSTSPVAPAAADHSEAESPSQAAAFDQAAQNGVAQGQQAADSRQHTDGGRQSQQNQPAAAGEPWPQGRGAAVDTTPRRAAESPAQPADTRDGAVAATQQVAAEPPPAAAAQEAAADANASASCPQPSAAGFPQQRDPQPAPDTPIGKQTAQQDGDSLSAGFSGLSTSELSGGGSAAAAAAPAVSSEFMSRLQERMAELRQERHAALSSSPSRGVAALASGRRRSRLSDVGGLAAAGDPRAATWEPPASPFGLIEEQLYADPWRLLVACLLLNKTTAHAVRKVIWKLFELCPTAEAAASADVTAVGALITCLGLGNKRAVTVQRFSKEYLEKDWTNPEELHGIGKYGADAYFMFCRGEWRRVQPKDKDLLKYRVWLEQTEGLGSGLTRDALPETTPPAVDAAT